MFSCKFCEISKNAFSYRTPPLAATVLGLYLFITHPCIFYIFHQVVGKPFKFISSGLETNDTLVNETNFLSFLSLFVYSFSAIAWRSVQTVLYKYQYSCILIFSVIWLGTIRLKYTVIVLTLIWEFRWCKQKANRKTEILFLLFTLPTIYPYIRSERFHWLRAIYNSLWLL